MDIETFLRGMVIGLAIAAPVGATGMLCIRRTLAQDRAVGLATGLGAATADARYGALAAAGLTGIFTLATTWDTPLRILGGIVLIVLGIHMGSATPSPEEPAPGARTLLGYWMGTTLLTLTNPSTNFAFLAIFSGMQDGEGMTSAREMANLVAGVFLGSALWWTGLTWLIDRGRGRISSRLQRAIGSGAGTVIAGFGVLALLPVATGG